MSTRLLNLTKDGKTVRLSDQAHIDAYKAKGWKAVAEKAPPRPKVKGRKGS